jgi:spermidine/putrescine transport system ATP-binding protein
LAESSHRSDAEARTPAPADLRLVDVRKTFGEVTAVDSVSLDIAKGEFFSLLGPSGCGKTTTLRMIGGFELPTSGRILLRDRDISADPPERRPVNMVFQSYALFPHLTVFENVAFGLRRRKTSGPEVARRVGAALELVHLPDFGARKPDQLSGGQQQRVALARALVCEPEVLLLDEPLGALDLKLRRQLQVELKRVQLEVGITFVYVTHDQEEALALSDRIAVMNGGRVEQLGTPEDLYDEPRTRFVAEFIGTTNILSGSIEGSDGDAVTVRIADGVRCRARVPSPALPTGTPVDLVVRPESITLSPDGDAGGSDDGLVGEISQSAYLGTSVSHRVAITDDLVLTAIVPRSHARFEPGDRVRARWAASDARVLARPVPVDRLEDQS